MMVFLVLAMGLYAIMTVGTYKLTIRAFESPDQDLITKGAVGVLSIMWPVCMIFTGIKEALR